jgi:DNA polymerase-1
VVKVLNIPIYERRGYEADDVIGSLAKQLTKENSNLETIIVTGDLDILQLVDNKISVYTMKRGLTNTIIYNRDKVVERYDFPPKYIVDYKGLKGDPSDNIPGVEGIGDKTATTLINKHGHLEQIYNDLENGLVDLSDRLKNNLKEHKKIALKSKDLATIRVNIDLDIDLEKMKLTDYDREEAVKLFKDLEFKSLLEKLPKVDSGKRSDTSHRDRKYILISKREEIDELIESIKKEGLTSVDLETDTLHGELIGISFCCQTNKAYYLPINDKFELEDVAQILEDDQIKKIGHGLKYDYRILLNYGVRLAGIHFDTMLAAHLLDPEKRSYQLDRLAFTELGVEMTPLTQLMGKNHQTPLSKVETKKVSDYSCEDADMSWQLYQKYQELVEQKSLSKLLQEVELPLIEVLAKMENLGVEIDYDYLEKFKGKIEDRIKEIEEKVYSIVGKEFNLSSPLQLREILFEDLNISDENIKKTKTGLSTAASELEKMRNRHPIVEYILEHRQLEKIRNTYLVPFLEKQAKKRIKTNFNQTVTATGRLSSSDPNLQNIPVRTQVGQEIRSAFVAQEGHQLVSLDYSQIELRIAAHLSGDKKMIEAFREGKDIHSLTAAELNNINIDDVSDEQRREAKTVNFGVLYGMSPYGLAQSLGRDRDYSKAFINNYFATFSGVRKYLEKIKKEVENRGYTQTLFGRKRYFSLRDNTISKRQMERAAINTPIQGTAADIIKMAMVELNHKIDLAAGLNQDKLRLLLQVHDELIFEIPSGKVESQAKKIKEIMESVVDLNVPLLVDVKTGPSWGDMKEISYD